MKKNLIARLMSDFFYMQAIRYLFFLIIFLLISAYSSAWADTGLAKEESIKKGERAYRKYCSVCHGRTGIGNGPGAIISGIPPADLTDKAYMSLFSDHDLIMRLKDGEDRFPYLQMAGIADKTSTQTIWNIVDYIRTLEIDKGPLTKPTPEERAEKFKDPRERGRIYYLRYCSPCHGVNGDGKGWAARTLDGTPAAHNDPILMADFTRQQIFEHVKGLRKKQDRKMPIFGKAFTPEIVKVIAAYTKILSGNVQGGFNLQN